MSLSKLSKEQWEDILDSVDKTQVPIDCIQKVTLRLAGRKQKTINISTLVKQGLAAEEIEKFLSRTVDDYGDDVIAMDFFVDVNRVSERVQVTTDALLGHL